MKIVLYFYLFKFDLLFTDDGQKVLFKTSNLNTLEIVQEFKVLCDLQEKRLQEAEEQKRRR